MHFVIRRTKSRWHDLKLSDNPIVRTLAVIVLIAAGIRLVFELLEPVWPYLLTVLILLAILRAAAWWRGRW